jgi:hypothetical protein
MAVKPETNYFFIWPYMVNMEESQPRLPGYSSLSLDECLFTRASLDGQARQIESPRLNFIIEAHFPIR